MTKKKSTKRALLTSALALLMCVSMLIGSTFAWFTDSVTSGSNIIKSGKLEVALLDANGDSLEGKPLEFVDQTGKVLSNILWEPGCTYTLQPVYVKNIGTLALKYEIVISGIEGNAKLLEAIEWTVDGATIKGSLAPDASTGALQITGHMKEEAGNEYQNLTMDGISITVYATQLAYESDSYGPDYDEEAVIGTYIELGEGEDLLAALASAEAGKPVTIKLMGNVEWPTEGHHGENDITPASAIVINGNGYTITATGAGVTPIGDTEAPMTLKNVKIVDNSVSYKENAWEFTYLEVGGTKLICDNVTFADEIQPGTDAIFTNCSFESNEESVYAVWVEAGSATFTNCTFTGYRGLKMHEDYGSEISSVAVKGCTFTNISKKPGIAIGDLNADTTVSVTGNTFINCQAGDQGLYIYETDTDISTINFTAENNTVKHAVSDMSGLDTAIKSGAKVIDAQGANLGDFYYDAKFTDGVTVQNAKFTYFYGGNVEGTVTFENCEFVSDHSYSENFDSGNGNIIFKNCTFDGWSSFGTAITGVKFENCTFKKSYNYGILRFYQNAELENCIFEDSFEGVDTNVTGTVVKFTDCTGIDGKIFNNGSQVGTWIVNGTDISSSVTSW